MADEHEAPRPGETFYDDEEVDYEIAELLGTEDAEKGTWKVVDADGDEAVVKWSAENERWEVDA